ncbi:MULTISPECIES: tRNA 2-thiocytidine(32) synthetase TtcA [unclassified Clostridium]|uniref:ExsB family protein n=1 Tax=Clostridium botulinum (strain Eklund 17B / Type B) TaxID=935198 RepID=B2TQ64_CLOBB|nr:MULTISPECIES: tRNA 2-thiocytidine(32) synthetase TtcA [unclassified Clostridium]ACD24936.1 ExsB family protein [Clostridium botulinum B str. Eklund 17B (NRP)]MBN1055664.1 tRNA 2-thiocytidine(32) synthetase TtcA [Clostridium botulinum]MBY6976833.1 tRNA 2-thiocytidine(32) synthetase TtcA [Clostridium botulinum]MBY7002011.1 tRNA 2-thiocytidine(32) synthetase TtcA [Clostridium botulinum]MCR1272936.1 tRNA 2-thiocytidine(32) synthetase TtcA [Clostridium botulinum]
MQKLLSKMRQAINDFDMIQDGDKIAVGLSGGKDSLTLLHLLNTYKKFSPQNFELIAITLNPGGVDNSPLYKLCENLEVPFYEIQTDIKKIVFDLRKEKNPCSLCANLRRGALHHNAEKLGCNKVALGHHKDDALETLMLSMCYEGRINCFSPKTLMHKNTITLIRPMVYIEEHNIKSIVKKFNFPVIKNPCPADGKTKRQDVKELIDELNNKIPGFKKNLFGCLNNSDQLFIWNKDLIK